MVEVLGLSHIAIIVRNIEASVRFYKAVFGATEHETSPTAKKAGIRWLKFGPNESMAFHLCPIDKISVLEQMGLKAMPIGEHRSMFDHIAFRVKSIPDITQVVLANGGNINARNIPYAYDPAKQLFIDDPDGYVLEFCLF